MGYLISCFKQTFVKVILQSIKRLWLKIKNLAFISPCGGGRWSSGRLRNHHGRGENKRSENRTLRHIQCFLPQRQRRKMTRKRTNWKRRRNFRLPYSTEESKKGRTVIGVKWSWEVKEIEAVALDKSSLLVTFIKAMSTGGGDCVSDYRRWVSKVTKSAGLLGRD